MRTAFSLALLLVTHGLAQEQHTAPADPTETIAKPRTNPAALATEWIHSRDAKTRAWGAYLAARDRIKEAVSDLVSQADSYAVSGEAASLAESDDHNAMLAVLDTLIQMDASLSIDTAAKLYPEFPAQSMILMAHSPSDATPALLHLFQTEKNRTGAWLASGNLLARSRAPGFAASVLKEMVVHARVIVTSGQGFGQGTGGGFGGSVFREPHTGWPEVGTYSLAACGSERAIILAAGVHPAYYVRSVNNLYGSGYEQSCLGSPDRDSIRADYLGTLLGREPGDPPVPSRCVHPINWSDDASYISELGGLVTQQLSLFTEVERQLQSAGLMTESEAESARPSLEIMVDDERQSKVPALPNAPGFGDAVSISPL